MLPHPPLPPQQRGGNVQKTYSIGGRTFVLDQAKAEAALAAKRVVGGRETMTFNLLPLRYGWAYELPSSARSGQIRGLEGFDSAWLLGSGSQNGRIV